MKYINYSGGAVGSDKQWEIYGKEFGVETINFTPNDYDALSVIDKKEVEDAYLQSLADMKRKFLSKYDYSGKLVRRDFLQAKYADAIYAISALIHPGQKDKKQYVNKTDKILVEGGTGYAVQMAINMNKTVYVYDNNTLQWMMYLNSNYIPVEIPVLTNKFAGIGTRELKPYGKAAIYCVYEKTFK